MVTVTRALRGYTPVQAFIMAMVFTLLALLVLYPTAVLLLGSLKTGPASNPGAAYGVEHYGLLFQRLHLVWNSLLISVGATMASSILGVALAWMTTRTNMPGRRTFESLIILPFYITPILGAVAWSVLLGPNKGLINIWLLGPLGLPRVDVLTPQGIIWVMAIYYAPFTFLFCAGALKSMDPSLEESSQVMGATKWQTAWKITLPLVMPAILGGALLVFVLAMGNFAIPEVLGTPRKFFVVTTAIYFAKAEYPEKMAAASAMGVSLFFFTAVGVYVQNRILRGKAYTTVTGKGYRPRLIDVKGLRWVLMACCTLYVLVSVVLPVGTLLWGSFMRFLTPELERMRWTLDNYLYVLWRYPMGRQAIANSLLLAFVGATLMMLMAGVVSWTIHRTRLPGRKAMEYIAMVPISIPGIVFALGLLWAWINVPIGLYGTLWIFLICYLTIFMPFGVKATSATIVQIDRSLEENARVIGASWLRTLRSITFPLLRPGLLAGWTLLFIIFMRELNASILIYTGRNPVLSVAIYDLFYDGEIAFLCALAMVQVVITFLVLLAITKLGKAELTLAGG